MADEQRTVQVLITMSTYGSEAQADKLAVSIAHAIHYGVRPGATVERVTLTPDSLTRHLGVRDVLAHRSLVPFDAILDDL